MPSLSTAAVRRQDNEVDTSVPPLRIDGRPLQTAQDVATYFGVPRSAMTWTLYRAPDDAKYRHFEIAKRSGGMRQIHSPNGLLRELQNRLHRDLMQLLHAHPNAHGFIAARSVVSNAETHVGRRWVLNVDLEDFFPSINFGRIRGLFLRPPFEMGPPAAAICAQIATFRNGLPQGAPTSPALSNFIAAELDRRLLRLARSRKLFYSRYADDITLSTDLPQLPASIAVSEQIAAGGFKVTAGDELEHAIRASGFSINPRKVRLQGRGVRQSVTGITVNTRVNVERTRIRRIRAMLHAWRKFGLAGAADEHFGKHRHAALRRPPRDTARAFRNVVYGELAFVKMVRGNADPVFLRLCAAVLEVDPNPSRFVRQMVFGADDYEVFISHASEDRPEVARPIFEACSRAGIKTFLDEEHIGWGENFTRKINVALGAARTVLAVVSSTSVEKDWPVAELNTALTFEVSGEKRVVVVLVGRPNLSKLPLLRSKDWLVWSGSPDAVVAELRRQLRPPPPAPAAAATPPPPPSVRPRVEPAASAVPVVPGRRGLLSRLLRRG